MSKMHVEVVIDTRLRLWLQRFWWLVAITAAVIAGVGGVELIPIPGVWG